MLCGSMFTAQLVFIVGVGRTENEVSIEAALLSLIIHSPAHAGCLFSHCCVAPLPVSGDVHVDADGGCGLVREAGTSVHNQSQTLHCFFHHSKLWLVKQEI